MIYFQDVSKFEDAEDAGNNGHQCTLIITDGYTASDIAIAGLSVLGRSQYGMFQLLRKTNETTQKKMLDISELNSLIKVVGLQYNKEYSTAAHLKSLRYGKLMIFTDQNEDGSNFKGLLIHFIHTNWPHLLRLSFLDQFITPVVKATKGEDKYYFFSIAEFKEWKASAPQNEGFNIKYYRGLGTCTIKEVKEYFSKIESHRVMFKYSGPEDDHNISKAFDENLIEQRREWLIHHMDECKRRKALGLQDKYLYTWQTKEVTFSEFINSEYVLFANYDNIRFIPSAVDGFTPGYRKVLHTCNKRNDKRQIRLAQLACSVACKASYYEDELSLCKIIIKMAQNYIGSNNINLLMPFGQFGTRLMGGKDCADHYDIFTMMSTITRSIFHPHDDPLLTYNSDENHIIEPKWYIPIIPHLLVNGFDSIGNGWSSKIPNHDPYQLIRCLRKMIAGEQPEVLTPHYKNFRGTIEAVDDNYFTTSGCLAIIDGDKIEITELPIGTWTMAYKENVLKPLLHGTENVKPIITDYKEFESDSSVRFVIYFAPGEFDKLNKEKGGFHRTFRLCGSISTNNMHAFDSKNCLRRYENSNDILKEFYDIRLEYYVKRRNYLISKLTAETDKISDQARFIGAKSNNAFVVENKTRKAIIDELIELGYRPDPVEEWKRKIGVKEDVSQLDEEGEEQEEREEIDESEELSSDFKKYDYLLGMPLWMLTEESKNKLFEQRDAKISELDILMRKSEYDLWLTDLEVLENKLKVLEEKERIDEMNIRQKDSYPTGENIDFKVTKEFFDKYCKDNEKE